jgi:hypothetical protein
MTQLLERDCPAEPARQPVVRDPPGSLGRHRDGHHHGSHASGDLLAPGTQAHVVADRGGYLDPGRINDLE